MAYVIALAGKGGTGKTTIAALTVRYLIERKRGSVLAVDADSNSCLNEALGVPVHATIGGLREESLAVVRSGASRPGGMSMEQLFDYQVNQAIVEAKGFDLLVMGRPEGPGCYCAANNIIRKYTDKLSEKYPYVVIDNEAGMEHLSRRTTRDVQHLLIVSDPTQRSLVAARRIADMCRELDINIEKAYLIINRLQGEIPADSQAFVEKMNVPLLGVIPADDDLTALEFSGRPLVELEDGSPAYQAMARLMRQII